MNRLLQTELHRHLDISARLSTVLELAQKLGLEPQSTSLQSFGDKLYLRSPLNDLASVLARFELFQKILVTPEILERVAFETVEDCRREGTQNVELRYSPSFLCEKSGLNWLEASQAFDRGVKRALQTFPEMRAGLICIASRDYGLDMASQTVEFFLAHPELFIGVDLAGNESAYPARLFQEAYAPAIQARAKITIHAGEAAGPDQVWEAIELLGAQRIGHGIASAKDPQLMEHLRQRKICLEICPTSNWLTQCVPTLPQHPLAQLVRAGVPVSINTDDPGVFPVTLASEIQLCRDELGLTETEIQACQQSALHSSFL